MGQDKALLRFNGEYLIMRLIRTLQSVGAEVQIIGCPQRHSLFGLKVIPDLIESQGPVSGIYTALRSCSNDFALVVACDMPFITPEFFRLILQKARGCDAVIARLEDGSIEPLCSGYFKSCLPKIEASLAAGKLRVTDFLCECRVTFMEESELKKNKLSTEIFMNINTPKEFRKLLHHPLKKR